MNKWLQKINEINEKYMTTFKNMQDVRNFQKQHGLLVDGKIGSQTEKKIKELYEQNPIKGSPENPIMLKELVVTAPDTRSNARKAWDRFYKDFTKNDPIFGERRRQLVDRYYGPNNPFRQANDEVANAVQNVGGLFTLGLGASGITRALAQYGLRAVPGIATAVAGAYAGDKLFDSAFEGVTGTSWNQRLADAGMNGMGRLVFNPGAALGSYGLSKLVNGVVVNGRSWLENTNPRTIITSQGPMVLNPGETVTLNGRPAGFQNASQGNFGYQSRFTTKSGGGRGSAAGQSGRVQTSQGNGNQRIPGGVQNRTMRDRVSGNNGNFVEQYTFTPSPYTPVEGIWFPWMGSTVQPTVLVPPAMPPTVEDFRLEELRPYDDPFIKWYAKQPEGTTQWYFGDPIHRSGLYQIIRTNPDPQSTTRLVGDNQGYVVPDSTTVQYGVPAVPQVNVLQGGVPAEAVRSNEKITGYRIGGKLNR